MTSGGPLKVWRDRNDALLRLRLSRPKANIVDAEMISALDSALKDGLADVRVKGAIDAVELAGRIDLDALRCRFAELGVWVRPFGSVVYLMPPFVIAAEDLATLAAAVRRVLTERAQQA